MNSRWTWVVVLAGVGVVAAVVGIVYFMVPVHLYPSWFPGHGAAKGKHRTTGAAIGLVALVAWAGAGIMALRASKEMFGARAMLHLPGGGSAADILVPQIRFRTVNDEEGIVSPARARLVVLLAVAGLSLGAVGTLLGVIALQKGQGGQATASAAGAAPATTAVTASPSGPPSATIISPRASATVKGTVLLDILSSASTSKMEVRLNGGSQHNSTIAVGGRSYYGWLANWDTTSVPNGSYTLEAVASNPVGDSANSPPIPVTVSN